MYIPHRNRNSNIIKLGITHTIMENAVWCLYPIIKCPLNTLIIIAIFIILYCLRTRTNRRCPLT